MIQLATDGIWLNHNLGTHSSLTDEVLIEQMMQQTYPSNELT